MSAPTDCRGTDQFQPNHRAGYGDRLTFLLQWLTDHPDATLASGEGRVLLDEINRLRAMVERLRGCPVKIVYGGGYYVVEGDSDVLAFEDGHRTVSHADILAALSEP